ncbi:MAG: type 2 isopentenyl-diphosphate Delta-isomerase [Bacteroidia bacterium]|nr:type 2 isopentenyl-diphosphate Delta-isomerase [Bacteroidia bacterium]
MSEHTSERKANHIDLAYQSQVRNLDNRFSYEPVLSAHPNSDFIPFEFLGKTMKHPLWVSSMTGGTAKAGVINERLARAAGKYGLGMGLGSCRIILNEDTYLTDFQLRKHIGAEHPFYANLGIAQLEELLEGKNINLVNELIKRTETDGLIIHVNPFQEWLQPEGDRFTFSPLETIKRTIDAIDHSIVVKEVGQGMGKASLKALLELPIDGIEFGAHGGTNFSALELFRADESTRDHYESLSFIGHNAGEMVDFCNTLVQEDKGYNDKHIIISGGIRGFLDGYYHRERLQMHSVYAQASALLKHAEVGYDQLDEYIERQMQGYQLAQQYLTIRES